MAIGYSRVGEDTLNVQISAQKVLTDLNQVAAYALSSPERRGRPGERYCGFGLHFVPGSDTYSVFGDVSPGSCKNSDRRFNVSGPADDVLYTSSLKHSAVTVSNALDILFVPPDPILYINGATTTNITEVSVRSERGEVKGVCVNPVGLISLKTGTSC